MSADTTLLRKFCAKLGLESRVCKLSEEYYRRLESSNQGQTPHPSLSHPQVRMCICIELACRHYRHPVEKAFVKKLAGITQRNYTTCFNVVESLLKVKDSLTIEQMAIQFSCNTYARKAVLLHKHYSSKVNLRQKEMGHDEIDFSAPIYKCAALIASARIQKGKVGVKPFCSTYSFTGPQLEKVVTDMLKYKDFEEVEDNTMSLSEVIAARASKLTQEKERKAKEAADLLWVYSPLGALHSVRNDRFLHWKADLLARAKS